MGIFRRSQDDEPIGAAVPAPRTQAVGDDFDTRLARGITGPAGPKLLREAALWELVSAGLEAGERRWAVGPVSLATAPLYGYGFATDRNLILYLSSRPDDPDPERWETLTFPFGSINGFSQPEAEPDHLELEVIVSDSPSDLGVVSLKVIDHPDFVEWCRTLQKLLWAHEASRQETRRFRPARARATRSA